MHGGGWSQGDLLTDWTWGVRQGSGMTLGLLAWPLGGWLELPFTKVRRPETGELLAAANTACPPRPLSLQVGLPKASTRDPALCSLGSACGRGRLEIPAQQPLDQPSISDPLSLHLQAGTTGSQSSPGGLPLSCPQR